jgi:hypothetical protein
MSLDIRRISRVDAGDVDVATTGSDLGGDGIEPRRCAAAEEDAGAFIHEGTRHLRTYRSCASIDDRGLLLEEHGSHLRVYGLRDASPMTPLERRSLGPELIGPDSLRMTSLSRAFSLGAASELDVSSYARS